MDTMQAFAIGQAARASGAELMVFDWVKAAELIRDRKPDHVAAGLENDWEWTGGDIWINGTPVPQDETYTYLASIWAIPQIEIDGEVMPCFRMESQTPGWDSDTYWPAEALAVIAKSTGSAQ